MTHHLAASAPSANNSTSSSNEHKEARPTINIENTSIVTMSNNEGDSDSISSRSKRSSNNNLQPLEEEEEDQHAQHQEEEVPRAAQLALSPPAMAACMTTGSSGSSSSGRRRFGATRLRATTSGGSRSPPAAAAARLPRDDNLYDTLVCYQEEHDDSTTVSMGETLRSVSTWYSVQSDDDRKIPARPTDCTYEGTYREPIRRPYRKISKSSGGAASNSSSSSSSGSASNTTPGQANFPATAAAARGAAGARFPPPAAATRRTSSGSMSRSVASGPPPVVWENEEEKDDHTCISSLAINTADRSEEESILNALSRYPLGGIDEGCAVGNGNGGGAAKTTTNNEFALLSSAAQLTQEANMGNMVETTRSAPTPYAGAPAARFPGAAEWDHSMDWAFRGLMANEGDGHKPPPPAPPGAAPSNRNTMDPPPNRAAAPAAPAPPPPPPMNDFTRMQQTLGMQDLCVPGSTPPSNNPSLNGSEQSGGSSNRRNRSGRSQSLVTPAAVPQSIPSAMSSISSQGTHPSSVTSNNPVEPSTSTTQPASTSTSSNDPAAQEQYQIWKQIQEEQERKQMELALQLSQTEAATPIRMEPNSAAADFEYPAQNAKPPTSQGEAGAGDGPMDEEEALKVALRLSEEEAAAPSWQQHEGTGSNGSAGEEDEIALALRLSEEQAEADRKRFQQMQQETAGELSEEEQLRLAMEQSISTPALPAHNENDEEEMRRALAESMQRPQHDGAPDQGNSEDVDEDMMLALRLSQAAMEEEERFRQSFLHPSGNEPHSDDPVMGSESFSELMPFPSLASLDDAEIVPPVRSRPSQEPAFPGLTPPGQGGNRQDRGRIGRRMMPSLQGLESLSQDVQKTFEQQQINPPNPMDNQRDLIRGQSHSHPAKIHGPDDGSDMPPVSRPQRKKDEECKQQDKDKPKPCNTEAINNVVDIDQDSRDVLVREGQSETRAAIMQGQSRIVTCRGCFGKLHAPVNCSLVFCPACNTVSQVAGVGI